MSDTKPCPIDMEYASQHMRLPRLSCGLCLDILDHGSFSGIYEGACDEICAYELKTQCQIDIDASILAAREINRTLHASYNSERYVG